MEPIRIDVTVQGLDEITKKADAPEVLGPALRLFFTGVTDELRAAAMARTPVDTAHLQRSHATAVDDAAIPRWGMVGTNVTYAVFVHEGTRPHFPPVAALDGWAKRHGVNPWAVAQAIARRGTRAQPWLRETWDQDADGIIRTWLDRATVYLGAILEE